MSFYNVYTELLFLHLKGIHRILFNMPLTMKNPADAIITNAPAGSRRLIYRSDIKIISFFNINIKIIFSPVDFEIKVPFHMLLR